MDDVRRQLIQFWRCNNLKFQLGVFNGDSVVDVSNFGTLYLSVRALDGGDPPSGGEPSLMLGSTGIFDTTLTVEDWASGAKQHAEITFSAEENAIEAGEYWISFWAVMDGGHILTLSSGVCKILENGGISMTPPEPHSDYYTAEECDKKLGNYYTKTESDGILGDYYTAKECDEKLGNYYTKTESDGILGDYYTAKECDQKFEPIGGGGGPSPTNRGELVTGNGSEAVLLSCGTKGQLLIADPDANLGLGWGNYPWQLREEISIGDPISEVIFEHVFDASLFWHYKLSYNFITTSLTGERLLMVLGYEDGGATVWQTSATEYSYNTVDFSGSVAKYSTYQFVDGFFGFGNDSSSYRNNGGWMHGEMDVWNDGDVTHRVQASAQANSYRVSGNTFIPNGGIYNFIYKNAGAQVIRSLKIYVANGTLTSGRFTLYGIR
jgi:hypothetical protein